MLPSVARSPWSLFNRKRLCQGSRFYLCPRFPFAYPVSLCVLVDLQNASPPYLFGNPPPYTLTGHLPSLPRITAPQCGSIGHLSASSFLSASSPTPLPVPFPPHPFLPVLCRPLVPARSASTQPPQVSPRNVLTWPMPPSFFAVFFFLPWDLVSLLPLFFTFLQHPLLLTAPSYFPPPPHGFLPLSFFAASCPEKPPPCGFRLFPPSVPLPSPVLHGHPYSVEFLSIFFSFFRVAHLGHEHLSFL